MRKTVKILQVQLWIAVAISLCIVLLFESNLLMSGVLYGNTTIEFLCASVMELLTVCVLPLALRLFNLKYIKKTLHTNRQKALAKWGSTRLAMLYVPMFVNTLLYYLFGMNVAFGYMAIILLIATIFIYPSYGRCKSETHDGE